MEYVPILTFIHPFRPDLVNRMRDFLLLVALLSACFIALPVSNGSTSQPNEGIKEVAKTKSDVGSNSSVQTIDHNVNNGAVPSTTLDTSAEKPVRKPTSHATEFIKSDTKSIKVDTVVNETSTASTTSPSTNSTQATLSNSSLPSTLPPNSCNHSSSIPPPSGGFHGWSFVGGILLVSALITIAFVGFKCYKMKSSYNRF